MLLATGCYDLLFHYCVVHNMDSMDNECVQEVSGGSDLGINTANENETIGRLCPYY